MKNTYLFALCAVLMNVACATNNGTLVGPVEEPETSTIGSPGEMITLRVGINTDYSEEISSVEFMLGLPGWGVDLSFQSCDSCPVDEPCFVNLEPFEAEVQTEVVDMNTVFVSLRNGLPFTPSLSTGEVAILNVLVNQRAVDGVDLEEFQIHEVSAWSPSGEPVEITLDDFRLQLLY